MIRVITAICLKAPIINHEKVNEMKRSLCLTNASITILLIAGCGGNPSATSPEQDVKIGERITPEYRVLQRSTVDITKYPQDDKGFIVLFDGQTFKGWRGYGKEDVPGKWTIDEGCIKFNSSGDGEGGDLIFPCNFRNFEFEAEWKISKAGNSGIFYLVREIETKDMDGHAKMEPIYVSAPEYQVLDNENAIDAPLGEDRNRQAASLYGMIPATPQEARPFGEWNRAGIIVRHGTVVHQQNGKPVVEYELWTPQWTKMLQESKFSEIKWPLAFELLNNCGGPAQEGYIGFQDMGYDVWFRNIKIRMLD